MVKNILGQGMDVHLLGLHQAAVENDITEALPLFQDASFRAINHFALSTSQIPTTSDSFMGYGPVVPDGYGCSYNPHADSIVFCVSSFRSCQTNSSDQFVAQLAASLLDVQCLLSKVQVSQPAGPN